MTLGRCPLSIFCSRGTNPESIINVINSPSPPCRSRTVTRRKKRARRRRRRARRARRETVARRAVGL